MVLAILFEYKQAFSKTSYIVTIQQSNLNENIMEVGKCLQSWILTNVIQIRIFENS